MFISIIIGLFGLILLKCLQNFWNSKKIFRSLKCKRVIITGGSSGIGLSLAKLAYCHGASVTIIARNVDKLKDAVKEIRNGDNNSTGEVNYLSVDITSDYRSIESQIQYLVDHTDVLINCAGGSLCREFCDIEPGQFDDQMRLNYTGASNITRILLPSMLTNKSQSHIVFVSSMAGQIGIYGYTAYSASKFALRGLAECLHMEVAHRGVSVTLAFPPDTQTPGFEQELIGKPEITKKLSAAGGLISSDVVAESIMRSTLKGEFFCSIGFDGWMLTQCTYGMRLPGSFIDGISLIFLGPLLRIVSIGYGLWMRHVVRSNS